MITVVDKFGPYPHVHRTFDDSGSALGYLNELSHGRKPYCVEVRSGWDCKLELGIAKYCFAQYSNIDGEPPYFISVYENDADGTSVYYLESQQVEMQNRNLFPDILLGDIISCFEHEGFMSEIISWEEI